jgi:hypothetical protein
VSDEIRSILLKVSTIKGLHSSRGPTLITNIRLKLKRLARTTNNDRINSDKAKIFTV